MTVSPFIVWLVCVAVGAILLGFCIRQYTGVSLPYTEGFTSSGITTCPSGTTEYVDGQGRTMCCQGELVNGQCSDIRCTLSCSDGTVPTCANQATDSLRTKSAQFCPPSAPNYYDTGADKGCTSSSVSAAGIPAAGGKTCRVYADAKDAVTKMDSCALQKEMEGTSCPTTTASKSLVTTGEQDSQGRDLPPLTACTYSTAKSVVPVTCYTQESALRWATSKYGGEYEAKLSEKGLSLSSLITLCPTSANYYVAQSAQKSAVTF